MLATHGAVRVVGTACALALAFAAGAADPPPPEAAASPQQLGRDVFTRQWSVAGTAGANVHPGLGPLFNASSCDSCHRGGAHGDGPIGDGPVPFALVVKLEASAHAPCTPSAGDPAYGRVFNTAAQDGVRPEGIVTVKYREITGTYYPGGTQWTVRDPQYTLTGLAYGALAPTTIVEPRIAPALYGLGLLEAVRESALAPIAKRADASEAARCEGAGGRFGWQSTALTVRDQAGKAFAREMGLTSAAEADDCTATQLDCKRLGGGGAPEVPRDSFDAVVAFAQSIPVPEPPRRAAPGDPGPRLFASLGCDECHRPQLPVETTAADGTRALQVIAPYTDLRLHDLGGAMADRTVAGKAVASRWRTAPLWGIGHRIATEPRPTFLHDGRARTTEEAILWHLGEAARAQRKFKEILPGQRETLLRWLETL